MMTEKKAAAQSQAVEAAANSSQGGSALGGKASGGEDYFASFDFGSLEVDMKNMLKAGVHFGHQKSRKNPKMKEYIFGTKNGINIIDLEKSVAKLDEAREFIEKTAAAGGEILFVGTKKQAKNLVESAARRCGMPFVIERWLGGTFTNFKNISGRTKYLRDGQDKMKKGEYAKYTKFEQMKIGEELEKLESKMGGIKHMTKFPAAIFSTGVIEDGLAIAEARKKKIPIIALVDTNVDPSIIDYPIPANEDAVSSLRLMLAYVCQAVLAGKEKIGVIKEENKKE